MLGFGQLAMMVGYDSESFILESVIHSIHEREPETISPYAGYYGQAVIFAAYTIASFLAPSILNVTTAKTMLIMSAVSYATFSVGFLFVNPVYFYISGALLGAGTACEFWWYWRLKKTCYLIDSVLHRTGKLLFSAFTGISILAVVTFFMIPSKDVENCIESSEKRGTFVEALMGILISALSKRIKGFGLKPTMTIGAISVLVYCGLVHVSTPFEAPLRPTSEEPLLIYHSYPLIFVIAFAAGVSDCCINGVRAVICALVLPERRVQSYSVARMYHAGACTVCFFFSPVTPLYVYTIGLSVLSVIATIVFYRVADSTKSMERKLTQISMEKKKIAEMQVC
uniref:Uncharacterized protein n=1 Tax=Caenorhabditis japonica TaxID=281687 RepID=A0A8R1DV52_CAEJA